MNPISTSDDNMFVPDHTFHDWGIDMSGLLRATLIDELFNNQRETNQGRKQVKRVRQNKRRRKTTKRSRKLNRGK